MKKNKTNSIKENSKNLPLTIWSWIYKTFIIFILICIITGCIVVGILSIYFFRMISGNENVDLDSFKLNFTTIIYADDKKTGEPHEIQRLYSQENRIWVDIDKMPKYLPLAALAIEDHRFLQHKGVDWKRTIAAFVNEIIPIYSSRQGGSTITQQLVKNITKRDEIRFERKIEEILKAIYIEKKYSKQQILEAYLNVVYFGNGANGVQAAANAYFDKDASELTLLESAAIVGITKNPAYYNPYKKPENNKNRREYVLEKMKNLSFITEEKYQEAMKSELKLSEKSKGEGKAKVQSYFVDNLIEEVIDDLVEQEGYTRKYAEKQFFSSGYRIYSTIDEDIQKRLEDKFADNRTFPKLRKGNDPQAAMIVMAPNGKIVGMVGGRGEKTGARVYNRATQAKRQPGSTIKPISIYGPSIEYDLITYSSIKQDSPITVNGKSWPVNYYGSYRGNMTIDNAIRISNNTIPVKLCMELTPQRCFNFLHDKLGMHSLVDSEKINGKIFSDKNASGMALGGLTRGVTALELAGAYQIYANGGNFTKPYSYTKILDSKGNLIYEKDATAQRILSEETAVVTNALLQRVVNGPNGTGRAAKFGNMPIAGKTGSTTDDKDLWFVGMTPYYIGVVWFGYDEPSRIYYGQYPTPIIWKNIMEPIHSKLPVDRFPTSDKVVKHMYCNHTGLIAGPYCPSTTEGYYKKSNVPGVCTIHSSAPINIAPDNPSNSAGTPPSPSWPETNLTTPSQPNLINPTPTEPSTNTIPQQNTSSN